MDLRVFDTKEEASQAAVAEGVKAIKAALAEHGEANIILATGDLQLDVVAALVGSDVDWSRVTVFHLDEYVALPVTHPASFRKYLKERFVDRLPCPVAAFHYIDGEGDCQAECDRLGELIADRRIDVAFIGIGENGHIAFNDPPADFEASRPFMVVELDTACRRQQFGEGWFDSLEAVPRSAITMTIPRIMKSGRIVCTVPDERKAQATQQAVEGPVTPDVPASVLQKHDGATLYLDKAAASLLHEV